MKNRKVAWLLLLTFAAIAIVMGIGAQRLSFNASSSTLLTDDNQYYLDYLTYQQRFNPDDFILIAFRSDQEDIFSENTLGIALEISKKIEQLNNVESTMSLATAPIFLNLDGLDPPKDIEELSWVEKRYSSEFLHKITKNHPLYENLLVNEAHDTLGIQVVYQSNPELISLKSSRLDLLRQLQSSDTKSKIEKELKNVNNNIEILESKEQQRQNRTIEQILDILKPYSKQGTFYLGGSSLLAFQLQEIIISDLKLFGSVILVLVSAVLYLIFRELRWILLPVICCSLAVICTLGALGFLGLKITVISANIIALQVILTLAILLHLIVEYRQQTEEHPNLVQADIVLAVLNEKIKPCFLATLTTGIGFATLVFSGIQPVISFGWMMMIAMAMTMIAQATSGSAASV